MVTVELELLVVECEDELELLVVECDDDLVLLVTEDKLLETIDVFALLVGDTSAPVEDAWPLPLILPVGLKEPDECGNPELRMLPDGLTLPDGLILPDGLKLPDGSANPVPVSIWCTPVPVLIVVFNPPVGKGAFDEPVTLMPNSECDDVGRTLPDGSPYE